MFYFSFINMWLGICTIILVLSVQLQAQEKETYNVKNCGIQHTDGRRDLRDIVTTLANDEFPWVAALIYRHKCDGKEIILCSGVLIRSKLVLTAAQCVKGPKKTELDRVRFGEYNILEETDCFIEDDEKECVDIVERQIERTLVHKGYNAFTRENDIALLKLESSVLYTDYIRPICLAKVDYPLKDQNVVYYISGWGAVNSERVQAKLKKKIVSVLLPIDECRREFGKSRNVDGKHICTVDVGNNTAFTSVGDAGAPLMISDRKQRWYLEGIFSWTGAEDNKPRVHTRISDHKEWIEEGIALLNSTCSN